MVLLPFSIELNFFEALENSSDMLQVLFISFTKNKYVIKVNIHIDCQLLFEQVIYDVLEGGRSIAVPLLHESSPIGAI